MLIIQDTPPKYNASALDIPVTLYWGGNDWLADPGHVKILMQLLPKKWYDKYLEACEHLDFIWGLDAAPLVYDDVVNRILQQNKTILPYPRENKGTERDTRHIALGICEFH